VAPALVNLRQAVEDANIANGAAAVRYPLAVTSMLDDVHRVPCGLTVAPQQTMAVPAEAGVKGLTSGLFACAHFDRAASGHSLRPLPMACLLVAFALWHELRGSLRA
jgi:hypothetical protein